MNRLKIAIFDFASCEGCQLQIVGLEEELLDLLSIVQPVEWREVISDQSTEYDVAIIEGSIVRHEDAECLKVIRSRAEILIALGACATMGGINKLKNNFDLSDVEQCVYGSAGKMKHLQTQATRAVDEVVSVDYKVHGCPINKREFGYIIRCLAINKRPIIPSYPVCVECKKKGNICRYEYNEICLGPVTRAGCDAPCPSNGFWCFGCRGFVDDPNISAAKDVMDKYSKTVDDLKSRMLLFGSNQEPTDA